MPRSAPLRFGISAVTVRPGILSARSQTSAASTNCGISFGGTKEQTSISGMPAAASASSQASFSAVGMNWLTFCSPSRMPTSQTWTSMRSLMRVSSVISCIYIRSSPLELRLALLVEGSDAFLAILGADHAVIGLDLEAEGGAQVHLRAVNDGLLRLAHRDRRVGGDGVGRGEHLRHQRIRLAELIEDAPLERLLGAEGLAGQDDLLGTALADRARQELRAAGARHDAEGHLREREARGLDGVGEVAGERHLEAACEGVAVERRDHGERTVEQRPVLALEDLVLRHPLLLGHAVALFQIAAGAECPAARSRQHDATEIAGLGDEAGPEIEEIAAHLGVESVRDLRPVERHQQHMRRRDCGPDRLVGFQHRTRSLCAKPRYFGSPGSGAQPRI